MTFPAAPPAAEVGDATSAAAPAAAPSAISAPAPAVSATPGSPAPPAALGTPDAWPEGPTPCVGLPCAEAAAAPRPASAPLPVEDCDSARAPSCPGSSADDATQEPFESVAPGRHRFSHPNRATRSVKQSEGSRRQRFFIRSSAADVGGLLTLRPPALPVARIFASAERFSKTSSFSEAPVGAANPIFREFPKKERQTRSDVSRSRRRSANPAAPLMH